MSMIKLEETLSFGLADEHKRVLQRFSANVRNAATDVVEEFTRSADAVIDKINSVAPPEEFQRQLDGILAEYQAEIVRLNDLSASIERKAGKIQALAEASNVKAVQNLGAQVKDMNDATGELAAQLAKLHDKVKSLGQRAGAAGAAALKTALKL
jgi:uncharacterized protein YoxC